MSRWAVPPLRALIVVLLLLALGAEVAIAIVAGEVGHDAPSLVYLRIPYTIAAIVTIACGQTVLIATWPLLARVSDEAIFTASAFRWVNTIIVAGCVGTVISFAVAIHVMFVAQLGPITVPGMLFAVSAGIAAFTLLMVVMRGLLRSATNMYDELAEVI